MNKTLMKWSDELKAAGFPKPTTYDDGTGVLGFEWGAKQTVRDITVPAFGAYWDPANDTGSPWSAGFQFDDDCDARGIVLAGEDPVKAIGPFRSVIGRIIELAAAYHSSLEVSP